MTRGAVQYLKNDFEEGAGEACLADNQNPKILNFERADWTLFRTVEGLTQKAGVPAKLLRRLVLKELGDNALDAGADIRCGEIDDDADRFFIEDDGPGLDGTPEHIAEMFSIRRPMRSTKLLRLPTRGALGNGLRVVAGAVLASEGSLAVITRNRRIALRPESDGSTSVVSVIEVSHPIGTRVEIGFGPALPRDSNPLWWVRLAARCAVGSSYKAVPHHPGTMARNFMNCCWRPAPSPCEALLHSSTDVRAARRARSSQQPAWSGKPAMKLVARRLSRCSKLLDYMRVPSSRSDWEALDATGSPICFTPLSAALLS
jgi:hypothetical protein